MLNSLLQHHYKDYMQEFILWVLFSLLLGGITFLIIPDSKVFIFLFVIITILLTENFMKYFRERQKLYSILPIKTNVIVHSLFIFCILITTIIFLLIIPFYFLMNTLLTTESFIQSLTVTTAIYNIALLIISLSILCEFYFEEKHQLLIVKYFSYVICIVGFIGVYSVINNIFGNIPWRFDLVLCSGITSVFVATCWRLTLNNYLKFNIQ